MATVGTNSPPARKSETHMAQHDLVIRNGLLVDGTGSDRRYGSIAVDGGLITAVADKGSIDERDIGSSHRQIDADGRLVTPG